jgi:2'-5' RNA ligase
MIALVPSQADLDRLTLPGGEPRDELHLTLWYLGDAMDITMEQRDAITAAIRELVDEGEVGPVHAQAFGVAHWNPLGAEPAWVLNVGDTVDRGGSLAYIRDEVRAELTDAAPGFVMPTQHTPWQPHVCVAYSTDDLVDELTPLLGEMTFDRVRVAFASEVTDVQLSSSATVAAGLGGDTVPWHKVHNHGKCPSGKPWAVVKDADGSVAGCHATESEANDQLAALYASEGNYRQHGEEVPDVSQLDAETTLARRGSDESSGPGDTRNDDCPRGQRKMPDGSCGPDSSAEAVEDDFAAKKRKTACGDGYRLMPDGSCMSEADYAVESQWYGVLVVEGVTTGDGREFAPNALTWADHALLRWQKEGSHGGNHDVTVSVGRIDEVWRVGNQVMGRGVLNLEEPDGWTIYNRMKNDFAGGISIDADDITNADVEFVWADDDAPESEADDGGDVIKLLFGQPEKMIYHAGRVRAATLCDIPAFVEAHIGLGVVPAEARQVSAGALPVHVTETSDEPWKVASLIPVESCAWRDGDVGALPHHEVVDGEVGAANLTACATALGNLVKHSHIVPAADLEATYEHLAAHLRDAGMEPPPLTLPEPLIAAGDPDWKPPRSWFDDPKLTVPIGITITDQGRVYGHVAQWGECHIGQADVCVTPPHEDVHPYFMTGEVVCADGSRVAVGQITVGTGHAPLSYRASRAAEHYDHTGAAVADVVVGNDAVGIWVAGAIRPTVEAGRVHELRASGQVSGDWRRIGGQLRLVGLLAVNVPGFPVPRLRARVASGEPQSLVAAGRPQVTPRVVVAEPTDAELDRIAMQRVMGILRKRMTASLETEGVN